MDKEKILVIQTAFIGDAILTLPMLRKLKELFPASTIDVVATPASSGIFRASPYTYKVYAYDKKGKDGSLLNLFKFARELKKEGYTRIYSPHRSFRTSLLVLLSGVGETYGFTTSSFRQVYKHLITYNSAHHEVQRNLELLGMDPDSPMGWRILPEVISAEEEKNKVSGFLSKISPEDKNSADSKIAAEKKIAAVAPGSVWMTKRYPKEKFLEVIDYLIAARYTVILIGGSDDAEYCSEIASLYTEGVISSAGQFSIVETIELLRHCSILISNDSAPTHFAMCADVPVVTIYCSTIPDFGFYPYSPKSAFVSYDSLSCKPCGIHGRRACPIKTFDCAYSLRIETIVSAIKSVLTEKGKD